MEYYIEYPDHVIDMLEKLWNENRMAYYDMRIHFLNKYKAHVCTDVLVFMNRFAEPSIEEKAEVMREVEGWLLEYKKKGEEIKNGAKNN